MWKNFFSRRIYMWYVLVPAQFFSSHTKQKDYSYPPPSLSRLFRKKYSDECTPIVRAVEYSRHLSSFCCEQGNATRSFDTSLRVHHTLQIISCTQTTNHVIVTTFWHLRCIALAVNDLSVKKMHRCYEMCIKQILYLLFLASSDESIQLFLSLTPT